jgi:hypothetical protein
MASDIVLAIFLCAAGLVFAAHFPLCQRRAGLICAASIAADNVCYLLAWSPIAPHMMMHCEATVIWSATALLAGGIIAEASAQHWWGRALIATYVVTILTYVLEQRGLSFSHVSMLTDYAHYMQIVILAVVGGGGVRNRVAGRFGRNRDHMDSHQATLQ